MNNLQRPRLDPVVELIVRNTISDRMPACQDAVVLQGLLVEDPLRVSLVHDRINAPIAE